MSTLTAPAAHRADAAPRDHADRGAGDGVARWVVRILACAVIVGCLGVLAAAVVVPRIGGATPYTVLTGSMSPGLPPGTLAVTRPVAADDIHVGMVITYQLRSGDPTVVTHRVTAVLTNLRGEVGFQTQGDANDVADELAVRPEQVRGELWYAVPHLGRVNTLLTGDDRQLLVYGAAGALVLYAAAMFAGAGRDRTRRPSRQDPPALREP